MVGVDVVVDVIEMGCCGATKSMKREEKAQQKTWEGRVFNWAKPRPGPLDFFPH